MSQCLNCLHQHRERREFCHKCRSKLLLRERYRAIKLIGQGGFGRTFLAVDEDKPSQPYCVIKQFCPQAQDKDSVQKASELFEQEAVRLEKLGKHPQIPELLAYLTQNERQYLVQEFIEGQNLAIELVNNGVFNESQIRSLLLDLLPLLQFIHSNQVIHRDLKPENIIRRQSDGKLILVDFGTAKYVTTTTLNVTGTVIGSAEYVAPEQSRGKAIFASDLYSLGVTCIHLLTNVKPFDLFDITENKWAWRQYLVNNPVSNDLAQILERLTEVATKKRYQQADEVLQALNLVPVPPKVAEQFPTTQFAASQSLPLHQSSFVSLQQPCYSCQALSKPAKLSPWVVLVSLVGATITGVVLSNSLSSSPFSSPIGTSTPTTTAIPQSPRELPLPFPSRENEGISRPYVGIRILTLTPERARQRNQYSYFSSSVPEIEGVMVTQVFPNTPAERAGIFPGDVIVQVGGRVVTSSEQLQAIVSNSGVNRNLWFKIQRGQQRLNLRVRTAQLPDFYSFDDNPYWDDSFRD